MMKLKALRPFYHTDHKTGRLVTKERGQEFEMDESEYGEEIFSLLGSEKIVVVDERFIRRSSRYTCIYPFSYDNENGERRQATAGYDFTLSQEIACRFMVSGHIKPVDPDAWTPKRLLGPVVKEDKIKKMFDDLPPLPKESWATKGVKR